MILATLLAMPSAAATGNASASVRRAPAFFEEPLLPVGRASTGDETRDLDGAIAAYQGQGVTEDVRPFTQFLEDHPDSPWRASLLLDLGLTYRHTGYFLRSLDAWEAAWAASKADTSASGRRIADRSVCELLELYCRLGRMDRIRQLFTEIKGRNLQGPAAERIAGLKDALWLMEHDSGNSFRCGPLALEACARVLGKPQVFSDLEKCLSTQNGTSLFQNLEWSKEYHLGLEAAYRSPGSSVVVPSVVHWKAGHFAAIVKAQDGRYLLQDPTFGNELWVSQAALDAEASGYALVPQGDLPKGWRLVTDAEARSIHGKGTVGGKSPDGPNPDRTKPKSCPLKGMPAYSFDLSDVALEIGDEPVSYAPPRGYPVVFHLTYSQQDTYQPQTCTYSNVGPLWNFEWLSYITDDPTHPGQNVTRFSGIGGQASFTGYSDATGMFTPEFHSQDQLQKTGTAEYVITHGDGSRDEYAQADGSTIYPRRLFQTRRVDPAGNALTFGYDAQMRLVSVTDALGGITTLTYGLASDAYKVTQVTDPFGRTAKLGYNASGQLASLTDAMGMTSTFAYGPTAASPEGTANFINAMTTPYGTTTFAMGGASSNKWWVQATDPLGNRERMEFGGAGVSGYTPITVLPPDIYDPFLEYRNVFYWDKRAMAVAPGNYNQAEVYHFLHHGSVMSSVLEATRKPLESWVFYRYAGQQSAGIYASVEEGTSSRPSLIERQLDDGTTHQRKFQYNSQGRVVQETDPAGRVTSFVYAPNGIDLLEVHNITSGQDDLLAKYAYNGQHRPLTATDASGQTTTFTYNSFGQIGTVKNAKGEMTTLSYDNSGYLQSIQGPLTGATTAFTYDSAGRIRTVTNPDGYTLTYDYDALDRKTQVTYMDGSTEQTIYDRLDVGRTKDRLDRWTLMTYNPIRQLTDVQDPQGRVTHLNWCGCGSLESLVDPMGHITSWARDLEGRVVAKIYPDLTQTSYLYDGAGRLTRRIDAKGQITTYGYFLDDDLKSVVYGNAAVATAPASYTYDSRYNRLATSTGGTGTTTYVYNPVTSPASLGATRLSAVMSPMPNSAITYGYDELGRVVSRSINGVAETRAFDALGRISTVVNPLGTFTYTYDGATNRLLNVAYPNGQTTAFTYFDTSGDKRLKSIQNLKSTGTNISTFDYTYDATGQIQSWSQAADAQAPKVYSFSYDAVGQLLGATLSDPATSQVLKSYVYGYDDAGNRTTEQVDGAVSTSSYNELNQLTGQNFSPTPSLAGPHGGLPPAASRTLNRMRMPKKIKPRAHSTH